MGSPVSSTSVVSNGTTSLPNEKSQGLGRPTSISIQKSSVTLTSGPTATTSSTTTDSGTLTDELHSTLTTLPIGVNFVTLDSVTYTSPTYITTTSPGSNNPTIVPIIFPFVGPPMICFNCFISFPPNIQIDVPQFCIQLFGLKIGNCPPKKDSKNDNKKDDKKDDKKGDKEEEKEGGDDQKEDDEEPTKSEEQSTTTSTSSSSCTVTITATHRSVFCSVTKGRNSADAACSTTAYTTATACSALGKATTVTTTETLTPVVPLCGPDTCGGRVCPETKEKRPKAPPAKGLLKRGEPALGQWPEQTDHPNHQAFIAGQIEGIARGGVSQPRYSPKLVRHFDGSPISAEWVAFKGQVTALALQGLYGCTSIILVSRRGAWVSHIWQTVIMNMDPDISFVEMVEEDLPRGIDPRDPAAEYYQYGLVEMKDHPELGDAGVMFGDDAEGIHTPASLNMRAFIVTPRAYMAPGLYRDPNGRTIPHSILNQVHHQRGTVRTPVEVERLRKEIVNVYGDIPLEVLDYNPFVPKPGHSRKWDSEKVMVDDDGAEYSLREYMAVKTMGTVRGKFLLQYQPARNCQDQAGWRLWFEGQPVGDRSDAWAPMPNQLFSPGNSSQPGRRQEQVCAIPVQSTPPAPGSPTSVGGPASSPISPPTSGVSSGKPPLTGNHTLSSLRTIPSVPVTLSSTSALGIVYPSGSSPVFPTSHANTTTIRFPVNNTDIWIPTTVGPVLPTTRVNTTTSRAAINTTDLGRSTTVDNLINTITTTIKVIVKPTTVRVPSSTITVVPVASSIHPTTKASSTSKEIVKTASVSSKPPSMTTTSSATKASSTSKEATKTTSSRSKPSAPAPSEAVAIYYVDTVMRDFNRMLEIEGAWWMFPVNVEKDYIHHDPCGKEPQGWKFLDTPLSLEGVPWPPSLEAEKHFFDRRFCKYKGQIGGTGYGTLTCENVPEFACERDPRAAKKLECPKDPVADREFVARVLCKFPTTEYREDVEEIASGGWVKTKVPVLID
ncbi:hypothetical protein LZ30DRAFT_604167 [Colletotrichum cereale]|nr:hypothetical protein LZ30DRAFT_604167 [Colletotrichum cereale]